jgi:thiol:disulfide interchange protein DsbD
MVGVGMAAPYVVLTSNPGLLKFLPKPGAWMHTFKHATGFLLLGTVVFLMVSVRQDLMLFTVAMMLFVALGCWWWGKFATFEQTSFQRARTLVVALAIAAGGTWFVFGPLRSGLDPHEGSLVWENFDPEKFARYQAAGQPVMLDFTAEW